MICWRISYLSSKRILMFAKSHWSNIWKRKGKNSLDSISSQIPHFLKFYLKDLNHNLFKKISRSFLMQLIKLHLTKTPKRKDQTKKLFVQLLKSWAATKKQLLWLTIKNVKDQLKDGSAVCKRKCKRPWKILFVKHAKSVPTQLSPKWENLSEDILPKWPWSEFRLYGPKKSQKDWKEQVKTRKELWNLREGKFNKWWNCSPQCVWKICLHALTDKKSKQSLRFTCINVIWQWN